MLRKISKTIKKKYSIQVFFMFLRRRLDFGARLTSYLRKMFRLEGIWVFLSSFLLIYLGIYEALTSSISLQTSSFPLGIKNKEFIGLLVLILVNFTWKYIIP